MAAFRRVTLDCQPCKRIETMARDNLLECFTHAYIICALWSSTDDDGNPLDDGRDIDDIAPNAMAAYNAIAPRSMRPMRRISTAKVHHKQRMTLPRRKANVKPLRQDMTFG